ncbi:ASCH domain-containing protein [Caballeronia sp. LjRoot31]|uniref:ASCH domain-containing protein n=1 Tax=Caballeronia sp. LjRoot31 TaxID=3342324 RepID=UPI003ECCBCE2
MNLIIRQLVEELHEHGIYLPDGDVRIGSFGDSEALSNELILLIAAGIKRATCSLLWSWEFEDDALPKAGDIEIVLDWHSRPALVRRAATVEIVPFARVSAGFAASEGEGDLSLSYWQTEHWRFFSEECLRIGRVADESMPLVCETFDVLHVLSGFKSKVSD